MYSSSNDIEKNLKLFKGITQQSYNPTKYEYTRARKTNNFMSDYKPSKSRDIYLTKPETKQNELERLMKIYYQVEYNKNLVSGNIQPAFNPSPYSDVINYNQTPILNQKRAGLLAYSNLTAEEKQKANEPKDLIQLLQNGTLNQPQQTQSQTQSQPQTQSIEVIPQPQPSLTQSTLTNFFNQGGGGGSGNTDEGEL